MIVEELFDKKGNRTFVKTRSRNSEVEEWCKTVWNDNNNIIHREWNDGSWVKQEYDEKGNCIMTQWNDGNIFYPKGEEYYNKVMRERKIEVLLNEEERKRD